MCVCVCMYVCVCLLNIKSVCVCVCFLSYPCACVCLKPNLCCYKSVFRNANRTKKKQTKTNKQTNKQTNKPPNPVNWATDASLTLMKGFVANSSLIVEGTVGRFSFVKWGRGKLSPFETMRTKKKSANDRKCSSAQMKITHIKIKKNHTLKNTLARSMAHCNFFWIFSFLGSTDWAN